MEFLKGAQVNRGMLAVISKLQADVEAARKEAAAAAAEGAQAQTIRHAYACCLGGAAMLLRSTQNGLLGCEEQQWECIVQPCCSVRMPPTPLCVFRRGCCS